MLLTLISGPTSSRSTQLATVLSRLVYIPALPWHKLTCCQVPCYGPKYVKNEDVIDFFDTAITYYNRFPTWSWLAAANIRPSNTTKFSLSDVQGQLTKMHGAVPYIGCTGPRYNATDAGKGSNDSGRTVIDEVWYYMNVFGRPQDGNAVPVNATGSTSSCAQVSGALTYPEPANGSVRS